MVKSRIERVCRHSDSDGSLNLEDIYFSITEGGSGRAGI
jgi:hypothetical protein